MKKLLVILGLLLSNYIFAQSVTETGNILAGVPYQGDILTQPTTQSLAATGNIQWSVRSGAFYYLTLTNAPGATATWVATANFQVSADGFNWVADSANTVIGLPGSSVAGVTSTTAVGLWKIYVPTTAKYIRVNVSAWTSGTIWCYLDPVYSTNQTITVPFTPSVTSGANLTGWINTTGINEVIIQVSAVTTTVVTAQGTNDPTGTTVQSIQLNNDNSANQAVSNTFAAAGTFNIINPHHKWVRFQVTTTGTVLTIQGASARFGQSLGLNAGQATIGLNGATINTVTNVTTLAQFTASAAAADATANPTSTGIRDFVYNFNGTTWDRAYGTYNTTTGDAGAKTASFAGATQTNFNAKGAHITVLCGTVSGTTPTLTAQLQYSPDAGTTWLNEGPVSTAITTTGNTITFEIYPTNFSVAGATPAALTTGATTTVQLNTVLPRTWRLNYTITGTTPSFAITAVYVNYNN